MLSCQLREIWIIFLVVEKSYSRVKWSSTGRGLDGIFGLLFVYVLRDLALGAAVSPCIPQGPCSVRRSRARGGEGQERRVQVANSCLHITLFQLRTSRSLWKSWPSEMSSCQGRRTEHIPCNQFVSLVYKILLLIYMHTGSICTFALSCTNLKARPTWGSSSSGLCSPQTRWAPVDYAPVCCRHWASGRGSGGGCEGACGIHNEGFLHCCSGETVLKHHSQIFPHLGAP